MCEWLSYGEWCDVKLLCGGRAFNAHRAVLASVSSFLRNLLLSCPDESPTFIVLPEFDLDALSSVLYYIYNGEVTVHKQKLNLFLDIINTLKIFIDSQYLPLIADSEYNYAVLENKNEFELSKRNVFTLGSQETQNQVYINFKKGKEIQDVVSKNALSISECKDSLFCNPSPSEEHKSLGDLKSSYGDRQRNSFLRDLFIETYPRNGNVNGLKTGVLAISNECYHAPTSVLLTNANGRHLNVDEILLKPYKKTSERISYSPTVFHLHEQKPCTSSGQDYKDTSKSFIDLSLANVNNSGRINNYRLESNLQHNLKNDWISRIPAQSEQLLQIDLQEKLLSGLYLPTTIHDSVIPSIFNTLSSKVDFRNDISISNNSSSSTYVKKDRKEFATKSTILNYVLENPWSPRTPQTYKPFRRKFENKTVPEGSIIKSDGNSISNDSNNNVDNILSIDTVKNEEQILPTGSTTNTASVSQAYPDTLPFKCTICHQVFVTRELLSAHMRRHSTNARYTCCECSKTFSQLRNFKYHMSIHRGTREFAATCSVCGKYFNDRGYLSSHMKIHRNRKEYKCTLCPKSFNQRVAYNMHVRIHTGVKPHVCEQCGKAFSRKMLLKQHQRTHSGERPYACPHCDKRFADRSNMTLHLRLHTGIKPFSCNLCPKSFTKKHHLKSHLNFHTGSKPYSCPRCKLAFTQSSNMRTHLKKCRAPLDSETS